MGISESKENPRPFKNIRGARSHLTQAFLDAYRKCGAITVASQEVGVSIETVWKWKKDKDFIKEFTRVDLEAQREINDKLRASALQRAVRGNPHFLIKDGQIVKDISTGKPVVAYYDFETALTIFMLKNRLPDEFKDRIEQEIDITIINTLSAEVLAIIRRNVPETCPHCKNSLAITPKIAGELETLSAKLSRKP